MVSLLDFVGYVSVIISVGYSEGPQPAPTLGAAATGASAARQGVDGDCEVKALRREDNKYSLLKVILYV